MRTSATLSTSSTRVTGTILSFAFTSSVMSARSLTLSTGISTVLIPARSAASKLLLQATNRQDATAQRDLACHRHVLADGNTRQHRDNRRRHCNARRRSIFRRGAFRHVDVDVLLVEHGRRDAEFDGARAHVG